MSVRRHDWMQGSNPHEIGGRAIDVSEIPASIEHLAKAAFPINGVPQSVVNKLPMAHEICRKAEELLDELVELVTVEIEKLDT